VTGDTDYVLQVIVADLRGLSTLISDVLLPHRSVAHVKSSIVLDTLKSDADLPLPEPARA
jgi:DNA-binding Lrp family transcriptional regulator